MSIEIDPTDRTEAGKKIDELQQWCDANNIRFFAIAMDFSNRQCDGADNVAGGLHEGQPMCKVIFDVFMQRFGAEMIANAPTIQLEPKQPPPGTHLN